MAVAVLAEPFPQYGQDSPGSGARLLGGPPGPPADLDDELIDRHRVRARAVPRRERPGFGHEAGELHFQPPGLTVTQLADECPQYRGVWPEVGPLSDHGVMSALEPEIGALALVDHHVHPALAAETGTAEFEQLITESDRPLPAGLTQFDSQVGLAIRRWCAPVLDLEPFAAPGDYLARRSALGPAEVTRRLLRASGTVHFLLDTGYVHPGLLDLPGMREAAGAPGRRDRPPGVRGGAGGAGRRRQRGGVRGPLLGGPVPPGGSGGGPKEHRRRPGSASISTRSGPPRPG